MRGSTAKLRTRSPETGDDLTGDIRKSLEEQGYPLKMRVASAFRRESSQVSQAACFEGPRSKEFREIDVLASKERDDLDITIPKRSETRERCIPESIPLLAAGNKRGLT